MENWFIVFYFIGISLSFISSSTILVMLLRIKYKDHSTTLRIYFTIIDIASSISIGIPYIPDSATAFYLCLYNGMYYFIIMLHGFWVFFMSLFLYLIICKKNEKIKKHTTLLFFCFLIISFFATIFVMILPKNNEECFLLYTPNQMILYLMITLIGFELLVLIGITFFYIRIRMTIKKELSQVDVRSRRNRIFCMRILGYPIMFFLFILFTELNIFQYTTTDQNKQLLYFQIRIMMVSYYPFLNSLLYGYTKSTKRYLWSLFMKTPDYIESQALLSDIRAVGFIKDRVYLDLADISESEIFN